MNTITSSRTPLNDVPPGVGVNPVELGHPSGRIFNTFQSQPSVANVLGLSSLQSKDSSLSCFDCSKQSNVGVNKEAEAVANELVSVDKGKVLPKSEGICYAGHRSERRLDGVASRDEEHSSRQDVLETSRQAASPPRQNKASSKSRVKHRKRRASDSFDDCENSSLRSVQVIRVQTVSLTTPTVVTGSSTPILAQDVFQVSSTQKSPDASVPLTHGLGATLAKPKLSFRVDELDDQLPLTRLENVTALSRSLIPPELLHPRSKRADQGVFISVLQKNKMATAVTTATNNNMTTKSRSNIFRKRTSALSKKKVERRDDGLDPTLDEAVDSPTDSFSGHEQPVANTYNGGTASAREGLRRSQTAHNRSTAISISSEETPIKSNRSAHSQSPEPKGRGVLQRIRSASRSRSRSRRQLSEAYQEEVKSALVAVTSCRSDAYHNQKAPGSTSKLPRKAPSNLKLFHELAVGVKDAYAAVGETPKRPETDEGENQTNQEESKEVLNGRKVLWEFIGNLDFLLALVDEVAIDTATRGALKDDTTFKSLRDVIKKCNKVLEGMLIRRERKYTLFIRLVYPHETKEIAKIESWNTKVEKAVGDVADTQVPTDEDGASDSEGDTASTTSGSTEASGTSGRRGMFGRGRQLLPSAGRVRARRATPTPSLRQRRGNSTGEPNAGAAEDGYSAVTSPITRGNLAMLQRSLANDPSVTKNGLNLNVKVTKQQLAPLKPMEPKDELVDVIRGLRLEKLKNREGIAESDLATLKPNWQPKADIPSAVPKLPPEYIHRHRLMKQVVNCLCEMNGAGPRDTDEEVVTNAFITSITSRHGDKAGNGKTTLAVAAIQSVEVRERFVDGIAWLHLGRHALVEKDIRRLYEELHRQLLVKDADEDDDSDDGSKISSQDKAETMSRGSSLGSLDKRAKAENDRDCAIQLANTSRHFQGGDLEGIKEELGRVLTKRKILICLDDVWRVEDAKWFIFDHANVKTASGTPTEADDVNPYRILMTTRTPALLGSGVAQEVFVRIFSEHEAVKLLLSSAGRRPYGGKSSVVFNQARVIVKGCGNTPLAVRLAGGMLRRSNRNWNLSSPTWTALMEQCKRNLEEASRLRSFVNSVTRIVDLSFATVDELAMRVALRRCFVTFALAFRDNEWIMIGKGIPQAVVLKLFATIVAAGVHESSHPSPESILSSLETMNLLQRARHGCSARSTNRNPVSPTTLTEGGDSSGLANKDEDSIGEEASLHLTSAFSVSPSFVIHDSIKAIAEDIAKRLTPAYLPSADEYTSFTDDIDEEKAFSEKHRGKVPLWVNPFRFMAQQLSKDSGKSQGLDESSVHEFVVASLLGIRGSVSQTSIVDAFLKSNETIMNVNGGAQIEAYMATFLPIHLIRAKVHASAGDILMDPHFISRRVKALGIVEGTRHHVDDLLDLRRDVGKAPASTKLGFGSPKKNSSTTIQLSPSRNDVPSSPRIDRVDSDDFPSSAEFPLDANAVLRDGSRRIVDEVYQLVNKSHGSGASLNMAICLSLVGEALLKGRQPRDSMLRLEEAVGIYRGLLGNFNIDVARSIHSVARALVKLGETRVASLKFAEAGRIYDACNATFHFDSIANAQNLAILLVDIGDWAKADAKFEEVVTMKKTVHGKDSVPVARTINSYAILLAKHGRMKEALLHYESAMATYSAVPTPIIKDPEFDMKCKYDMTLINLNIASIRSKKGDLQGAIKSYEEGVKGLRQHAEDQAKLKNVEGIIDGSKLSSQNKHLVAALGRIGSLKLKLGDNDGALQAYIALLEEVDDVSPSASRIEKAKAHIKCATIYRQREGKDARIQSISHLREALEMYTALFGPEHKDTLAIASSLRQWLSEDPQSHG